VEGLLKPATRQSIDIEDLYLAAKERYRALTVERANRIVENWEIAHFPDARDRELVGQIHAAKREFLKIEAQWLSARGEYFLLGCAVGEHKHCKRQVKREGAILACACPCHQTQAAGKEKSEK
jgi:hypothetical protein